MKLGSKLLAGVASSIVFAAPAISQDSMPSGTESSSGPEEIVVTARRVVENVQKIPVAVTVITTKRLEELQVNTGFDLNKISGLSTTSSSTAANITYNVRGQGAAFGTTRGVIPYFAEVPNFPQSFYDLQNIQVIKGPQGTLFGQTAVGGVVLFEPKKPSLRDFEGYASIEAGNYNYKQAEGAVNLPIVEDKLAIRAAFRWRQRDGQTTNIYSQGRAPEKVDDLDEIRARLSVTFRPVDGIENYTMFAYDRTNTKGPSSAIFYYDPRFINPALRNLSPAILPSLANPFQFWAGYAPPPGQTYEQLLTAAFNRQVAAGTSSAFSDYATFANIRNYGLVNQTTIDLADNISLKNVFGLYWTKSRFAYADADGTALPLIDTQCAFVPGSIPNGATSSSGECASVGGWPSRNWSNEVQLRGSFFDKKLQWQFGAIYQRGGNREFRTGTQNLVLYGNGISGAGSAAFCTRVGVSSPCVPLNSTKTYSYGAYGQISYNILDHLRLTAGYRKTKDYTRLEQTAAAFTPTSFNGTPVSVLYDVRTPISGAGKTSFTQNLPSNSSYNLSADWQISDNVLLYAAHRKGYKTGGINNISNTNGIIIPYNPERIQDIEIGAKTTWSVGAIRGQSNVALFDSWYKDIQGTNILPGQVTVVTTNIADASIKGIEFDSTIYISDIFRVSGYINYIDAKYTDWTENTTCGAQYFRPQCSGLLASTPIIINHSDGNLTIGGGQPIGFKPDKFPNAAKITWSISPTVLLKPLVGEDISIGLNIYHRGSFVDGATPANSSVYAGSQPNLITGIYKTYGPDSNPYVFPGFTLYDLRVEWNDIRDTNLSAYFAVTNLTNKSYLATANLGSLNISGGTYGIQASRRMWFVGTKYRF